jgi:voltage-gated potassium channel
MIAGIGTVLYAMGNVVAFFIDGQIRMLVGRRQLMHKISAMSDHFVIVGFGRMGRALCTTLQYKQVPFVLIENSENRLEEADELGIIYVNDDAMQESTLVAAGIDRARGMATCLPHDADNVFVTLTARGLHERIKIIARAEDFKTEAKLRRAGADRVICPPLIGATRITDLLLNPAVEELLELDGHWPDLELSKLAIQRFPRASGKTLDELSLSDQQDLMVIAVVGADGQQRFNPGAPTRLDPGDELVVVARAGRLAHIIRCLERADAA